VPREEVQMKKKTQIFIAIGMVIAVIALILALRLTPWFYAINTRVRLYLDAPAETKIKICWAKKQTECLPLVPFSEASNTLAKPGEVASVWLGELPPRPVYHISLVFKSGIHEAAFHELELDSSTTQFFGVLPEAGVGNIRASADQFKFRGISYKLINPIYRIESDRGGKLTLTKEIKPRLSDNDNIGITTATVWVLLYSIFLLFIIPFYLLPRAVENLGSALKNTHLQKFPWWVYILSCVAIGSMVLLIVKSPALINPADPIGYLQLATGGGWFNAQRMPGYPLFLGLALWVSRNSLNGVILFQVVLLILSTLLCIWILRRWLHPIAAVLFVFLCLLSPTQVHYARWIFRESLFASLVLFGITVLIAHFTGRKPYAEIWFVIYTIICAVAFLVRENGILLSVAMIPALLPKVIKSMHSPVQIRERLWSIFLLFAYYSIPLLALGLVYIGFGVYNYIHYGYFQIEATQKSHHYLARTILASNFDARSLLYPTSSMNEEAKSYLGWPLYSSFILTRDQTPGLDPIHTSIYQSVIQRQGELGLAYNLFHSASILDDIGKSANSLVSWQANFAGSLRHYSALIFSKDGGYSLIPDDPTTLANKREWLSQVSKKIKYAEKSVDPGSIVSGYYNISQGYQWYGLLVILALLSSLYVLRYEDPIFLAPITVFVANGFLLVFTRLVAHRYISSLDVLLILQIALGLSFWMCKHSFHILKNFTRSHDSTVDI
jgi:hypothetical protein